MDKMFQVNYVYVGEGNNQRRTDALLMRGPKEEAVKQLALKTLASRHDWFKITSIREQKGENVGQQQL